MADEALDISYRDMLDRIAGGVWHFDDRWSEWYQAAEGDTVEDRIRSAFEARGHLPTPPQYDQVIQALLEQDERAVAAKTAKKAEA
jgi:hypothetical protein